MEVLDKVYTTFCNLESDYKRSKKSRRDFIVDKFGGDIDIGSIIILDAVSSSEITSAEDIEKLTFVKKVVEQVRSLKDSLDSVTNFAAFTSSTEATNFLRLLEQSYIDGTGQKAMFQPQFHQHNKKAFHYTCTAEGAEYVPMSQLSIVFAYNDHMTISMSLRWKLYTEPKIGDYFDVIGNMQLEPVPYGRAIRKLRGQ